MVIIVIVNMYFHGQEHVIYFQLVVTFMIKATQKNEFRMSSSKHFHQTDVIESCLGSASELFTKKCEEILILQT